MSFPVESVALREEAAGPCPFPSSPWQGAQ